MVILGAPPQRKGPFRGSCGLRDPHTTERASSVYRLPGLSIKAATLVVELAEQEFPDWHKPVGRPRSLTRKHSVAGMRSSFQTRRNDHGPCGCGASLLI